MKSNEVKKLDKLWREAIKERDVYCQVCNSSSSLNAHHIIGRRNRQVRWDLNNGILLCSKHHVFDSKFSAHQTPTLFGEWFIDKYPDRHEEIKRLSLGYVKQNYENVKTILTNP